MPGRHYQIVTGGSALGIESIPPSLCLEGSTPEDGMFFPVYCLGEDGDLKKEGGGMLLVWALRARSYKTRAEA